MRSWGAIFDWDGVILDSSRPHELAWRRLAELDRLPLPPGFFQRCFGMKNDRAISELLGWSQDEAEIQRLSERKEEFYREILCQGVVAPLPGVVPWLEVLAAGRVPSVIASSTVRRNIECVIGLLGVDRFFGQIVSAEDVLHGKPSPEIFLLAARRLGLEPARCVVFEDSHVGIEAGLAAGMRVVAVAGTHPASSLQRAHRVVNRLDELTLADLDAWH